MAVVLADGIKGDFRFCVETITAARFYNPDDHSLKLPSGGRLKKRERLTRGGSHAQRVLEASSRSLPDTSTFDDDSHTSSRR